MKLDLAFFKTAFAPDIIAVGLMLSGIELLLLKMLWAWSLGAEMPLSTEFVLLCYVLLGFMVVRAERGATLFELMARSAGKGGSGLATALKLTLLANLWPLYWVTKGAK